MALRPEDRYESPRALADDVERWMADEPVSAYSEPWGCPRPPMGAAAPHGGRHIGLAAGRLGHRPDRRARPAAGRAEPDRPGPQGRRRSLPERSRSAARHRPRPPGSRGESGPRPRCRRDDAGQRQPGAPGQPAPLRAGPAPAPGGRPGFPPGLPGPRGGFSEGRRPVGTDLSHLRRHPSSARAAHSGPAATRRSLPGSSNGSRRDSSAISSGRPSTSTGPSSTTTSCISRRPWRDTDDPSIDSVRSAIGRPSPGSASGCWTCTPGPSPASAACSPLPVDSPRPARRSGAPRRSSSDGSNPSRGMTLFATSWSSPCTPAP